MYIMVKHFSDLEGKHSSSTHYTLVVIQSFRYAYYGIVIYIHIYIYIYFIYMYNVLVEITETNLLTVGDSSEITRNREL